MSAYPQAANICPCESLREALRKPPRRVLRLRLVPPLCAARLQQRVTPASLRYKPETSSPCTQVYATSPRHRACVRKTVSATLPATLRPRVRTNEPRSEPAPAAARRRAPPVGSKGRILCRRPPRSDRPPPLRPAPQRRRAPIGKFATKMSNLSLRPTYREVTVCDGTFPDTATYLHGFDTLIGFSSFESGSLARYATVQNIAAHTRIMGLFGLPAPQRPSLLAPRFPSLSGTQTSLAPWHPVSPVLGSPAPQSPGTPVSRPRTAPAPVPQSPGIPGSRPPGSLSFAFAGCDTLGNRNLVRRRIFLETLSADAPC